MKLINLIGLSICTFVMTGCSVSNHKRTVIAEVTESCHSYTVYIDNTYPADRQIDIQNQSLQWIAETDNDIHLSFEYIDHNLLNNYDGKHASIVVFNKRPTNPDQVGWTNWGSDWAHIEFSNEIESDRVFKATALHEFGHAFHIEDDSVHSTAIMGADGFNITCYDLDQFCALWKCRYPIICGDE